MNYMNLYSFIDFCDVLYFKFTFTCYTGLFYIFMCSYDLHKYGVLGSGIILFFFFSFLVNQTQVCSVYQHTCTATRIQLLAFCDFSFLQLGATFIFNFALCRHLYYEYVFHFCSELFSLCEGCSTVHAQQHKFQKPLMIFCYELYFNKSKTMSFCTQFSNSNFSFTKTPCYFHFHFFFGCKHYQC